MAMAIRSALTKLATTSIRKNTSGVLMLRAFASSSAIDKNPNLQDEAVSGFTGDHYNRDGIDHASHEIKRKELKVVSYYMDLAGLEPARFAMEEFNKRKVSNC